VSSFAIVRALLGADATTSLADDEGLATGVVHVASSLTNISVVERGVPRFTRISSLAGGQFTQAIARALDVTYEQAEELKIRVGLPAADGSVTAVPDDVSAEVVQAVHDCLEREVNKFIAEIRRSLDYYLTQTSQVKAIRRILLTGSGAQLLNLAQYLEKGLQAQVLLGDPLANIGVSASVRQRVEDDRMGCATAIGLALGGLQA
jgi:type IV pilus assembly protein PilM